MAAPKYTMVFGTNVALVTPTASTSGSIPAGTECIMVAASGNIHFRIGVGAQTAVATDPLVTPGTPIYLKLTASQSYTIAAIFDPTSTTGTLTATVVMEA